MEPLDLLERLGVLIGAGGDLLGSFNQYLALRFGRPFQLAVDWVLVGLALVALLRLLRLVFDVLRYVLLPSVVISGVLAASTTLSFLFVLPLALGVGTIIMLLKS